MRALRLHHELYSAHALEEASAAFSEHADIVVRQQVPYFELCLTAKGEASEDELLGELANYILALTVEEKRVTGERSYSSSDSSRS